MRHEVLRWTRSKRLLIVLVAFIFSGTTSPLVAAYSQEIFSALSAADNVQLVVETPNWQDAIGSYLQNSSQLALIFVCYLAAWGCSLGPDEQLRIYYISRVRTAGQILLPRVAVSAAAVLIASAVGASIAIYTTWALFDDLVLAEALTAVGIQTLGILLVALVSAAVAWHTNSPAVATVTVYGFIFVGDLFRSTDVGGAMPSVLVRPVEILAGDGFADLVLPLAVTSALALAALGSALVRPVRSLN